MSCHYVYDRQDIKDEFEKLNEKLDELIRLVRAATVNSPLPESTYREPPPTCPTCGKVK